MLLEWFVYLAVGRVCIFFVQKFPIVEYIKLKFVKDLVTCDLCLGFWVYSTLAYNGLFQINLLSDFMPENLITTAITGAVSSLLVHLVRIGWQEKFGIIEVS